MKEGGAECELEFHPLIPGNGLLEQGLRPNGPKEAYHGPVSHGAACVLEVLSIG
jgi:hypothetical protein